MVGVILAMAALVAGGAWRFAGAARAQSVGTEIGRQLQATAGPQGAALGNPVDPRVTVIFIIRLLLGLTTIVLVSLNIYAGVMWMTAGGNEEQVEKAKTTLRNAAIGLVIVLSSYTITIFAAKLARGYSTTGSRFGAVQGVMNSFLQTGK